MALRLRANYCHFQEHGCLGQRLGDAPVCPQGNKQLVAANCTHGCRTIHHNDTTDTTKEIDPIEFVCIVVLVVSSW